MIYPFERVHAQFIRLCGCLVFIVIVGAFVIKVDVISQSSGVIKPSNQTQYVQHLEGGIIQHIYVKEGQHVSPGDILIELDPIDINTKLEQLATEISQLSASKIRLNALIHSDKMLSNEQAIEERIWESEKNLYQTQMERHQQNIKLKSEMIAQAESQAEGLRKSVELLKASLALIDEDLSISQGLMDAELSSRSQHIIKLDAKNKKESELNEKTIAYLDATRNIEIYKIEKSIIEEQFIEKNQEQLTQTSKQLMQLQEELIATQDQLSRISMQSPTKGIIQSIRVNNAGEVILPGETVITITPTNNPLMIEAKIAISDIGWIKPGMPAKIRLPMALSGRYPAVDAEVTYISSDRIVDDQYDQVYYKSYLSPQQSYFGTPDNHYQFHPGMSVDVSFIIGQRSIIHYLLDPIHHHSHAALSEP
ncbi:MAG: hypothetical protein CMF46_04390 [Legionellales bacterium]|nr:hypothetical protein [Legionellales bacterium]|tara:strand:+ start:987 stop:2252 length:1266 start_codon:yes stop_codon:yes gene_type:complete